MCLTDVANQLQPIWDQYPAIGFAMVFGSVAEGRANQGSDLDLAVKADQPLTAAEHTQLVEQIALATGRPVDLIDLATVGEPLLGEILTHGKKLFGSTDTTAALMQRHVYMNEDFVPYVERMLEERNRQWLQA